MRLLAKLRAVLALVVAQLRHRPSRTALAVVGITLAVLSTTLLASVGFGVLETGEQKFDQADRDIWITGGPIELSPGAVGGFQNTVLDAHNVSAELRSRDGVRSAVPMAFQTVYVGRNASDFDTVVGVGVPGAGSSVSVVQGTGFQGGDTHYAEGTYTGEMTHEVIIDRQTADNYNVSVGDTLYIGGTLADARANEFTVVGISPTFSQFLGAPTVTTRLSELQTVTGSAGTDRATWITVAVDDDADVATVHSNLQEAYPEYDVRTNREQMEAILNDKAVLLAAAATLVALAVVAGLALTVNLLALVVYQQQRALAALRAVGLSARTLGSVVAGQGFVLGILGGAVGLGLTPPLVTALNRLALELVGFENLLRTPDSVFLLGGAIAVGIGTISALVAGWRITRLNPLQHLR